MGEREWWNATHSLAIAVYFRYVTTLRIYLYDKQSQCANDDMLRVEQIVPVLWQRAAIMQLAHMLVLVKLLDELLLTTKEQHLVILRAP
jgi:hypothetical protein